MWPRLLFILLLWACQVQPYYDDAGHLDSPYNGTDHYIDTAYGYDSRCALSFAIFNDVGTTCRKSLTSPLATVVSRIALANPSCHPART